MGQRCDKILIATTRRSKFGPHHETLNYYPRRQCNEIIFYREIDASGGILNPQCIDPLTYFPLFNPNPKLSLPVLRITYFNTFRNIRKIPFPKSKTTFPQTNNRQSQKNFTDRGFCTTVVWGRDGGLAFLQQSPWNDSKVGRIVDLCTAVAMLYMSGRHVHVSSLQQLILATMRPPPAIVAQTTESRSTTKQSKPAHAYTRKLTLPRPSTRAPRPRLRQE